MRMFIFYYLIIAVYNLHVRGFFFFLIFNDTLLRILLLRYPIYKLMISCAQAARI